MMFSVIEECADRYKVTEDDDGSVNILIHVPARFASLVTAKLNDLYVTEEEIEELAPLKPD